MVFFASICSRSFWASSREVIGIGALRLIAMPKGNALTCDSVMPKLADMSTVAIEEACRLAGGASALSRRLAVTPTTVSEWRSGKRTVPIERCVEIERATEGAVTRMDLRPDDWHRIWPELAAAHPDRVPPAAAVPDAAKAA